MRKDELLSQLRADADAAHGQKRITLLSAIAAIDNGKPILTHEVTLPNGLRRRYPSAEAAKRCVLKYGGSSREI